MNIWEQKNRETWASMPDHNKTTEKLKALIISHKKAPHVYDTPTDQWFFQFACEDLTARGEEIPNAERECTTDFKYRLERYGY
mgnify:CR=1 FL=1